MVFRAYGVVCAVFLVLFILVNFYNRSEGSFSSDLGDDMDPKNVSVLAKTNYIFQLQNGQI